MKHLNAKHLRFITSITLCLLMMATTLLPASAGQICSYANQTRQSQQTQESDRLQGSNENKEEAGNEAEAEMTSEDGAEGTENLPAGEADRDRENQDAEDTEEGTDFAAAEAEQDPAQSEAATDGRLSCDGDGYQVTVAYDDASGLSSRTRLDAARIEEGSEDYRIYSEAAARALGANEDQIIPAKAGQSAGKQLVFAGLYDITLSEEGGQIEPAAPVDVNISYDRGQAGHISAADTENLQVLHLEKEEGSRNVRATVLGSGEDTANSGRAAVDARTEKTTELSAEGQGERPVEFTLESKRLTEVDFTAESFSVYAVAYTVDFHYGDGSYDFSIEGGSSIRLSEILDTLKLSESIDPADIAEVTFSDPDLIRVEKLTGEETAGDWLLSSRKAFNTEETLTLTLSEGSVITIRVTDAQDGQPVCKITDTSGRILYYYNGKAYVKAVFDSLETAFSRAATLYTSASGGAYSTSGTIAIQMLTDKYTQVSRIDTPTRDIILTTAGRDDEEYPYRGPEGTCATIQRGGTFTNYSMFRVPGSSTLRIGKLTLDGMNAPIPTEGAIIHVDGGTVKLKNKAVLQNGYASRTTSDGRGGGVYVGGGKLEMYDGSVIQNCTANRDDYYAGGGVCIHVDKGFYMYGGTIRNCSAPHSSGGGIAVNHHDAIYIFDGLITGCTAEDRAGAIEIHGYAHMSGGTVTGNSGGVDGGAINMYNSTSATEGVIYLSGSPKIYDNYNSYDENNAYLCNLDVYHHCNGANSTKCVASTDKIRLEGKLSSDAVIGVWAGQADLEGQFGIRTDDSVPTTCLSCFRNDQNEELYGAKGPKLALVWGKGVRMIAKVFYNNDLNTAKTVAIMTSEGRHVFQYTDGDSVVKSISDLQTIYREEMEYKLMPDSDDFDFRFATRQGDKEQLRIANIKSTRSRVGGRWKFNTYYSVEGAPNTYSVLDSNDVVVLYYSVSPQVKATDASGNLSYLDNGNPAIFSKLATPFEYLGKYRQKAADGALTPAGADLSFRLLTSSCEQSQAIKASGSYRVTLTTEGTAAADGMFPGPGGRATVRRAYDGDSMISTGLSRLTMDQLILDGGSQDQASRTCSGKGGLIAVNGAGKSLWITDSASLCNSVSSEGGAVWLGSGTNMSLAGTIENCSASGNGGGVLVSSGASMTMMEGTITGCQAGAGGAAVMLADADQETTLAMTGGSITGNPVRSGESGAVQMTGDKARLNFGQDAVIYDNKAAGAQQNVFLKADSNRVINAAEGLGENARIGVYVPDGADYFDKHGGVLDAFGSCGADGNMKRFINDRNGLTGSAKAGSILWMQKIRVKAVYTKALDFTSIPSEGRVLYEGDYAPSRPDMSPAQIGQDIQAQYGEGTRTMEFWRAYNAADALADGSADAPAAYENDIRKLVRLGSDQGSSAGLWGFERAGMDTHCPAGDDTLVLYYTEPVYLSLDNQTAYDSSCIADAALGDILLRSGIASFRITDGSGAQASEGSGSAAAQTGDESGFASYTPAEEATVGKALKAGKAVTFKILGGAGRDYSFRGGFDPAGADPARIKSIKAAELSQEPQQKKTLKVISARGNDGDNLFSNYSLAGTLTSAAGGTTRVLFEELTAESLTITKTLEGKYADLTRSNSFTILLPGQDAGASFSATIYDAEGNADRDVTLASGSSFELKNGEKIVIREVPLEEEIRLTETDAEGYELSLGQCTGLVGSAQLDGSEVTFTMEDQASLSLVNTRTGIVDSGLASPTWIRLLIALAAIFLAAAALMIHLRHRRRRTA